MSKEILRPQKAQPAPVQQEPVAWMDVDGNVSDNNDHNCFPIPLYTTANIQSYLEKDNSQPEQNEFELRGMLANLLCWHRLTQVEEEDLLRFAAAQPEQEPVAWMNPSWIDPDTRGWQSDSFESIPIEGWLPIYTTPPQRPWVGLTDEDKHLIELSAGITEDDDGYIVSQVFKLTEAKLRSKNNAT